VTPGPEIADPKVFQIGLTGAGTRWLRQVFKRSGYAVAPPESPDLVTDICFAARTGGRPLSRYGHAVLFTDLEHTGSFYEPPLLGQHEFALLHQHFPDAYFVLNVADPDTWLHRRVIAGDGRRVRVAAHAYGVDENEVPELWRRSWLRHEQAVRDHFAGHDRFTVLDVESQGLTELSRFVAADYALTSTGVPPAPRRSGPGASPPTTTTTTPSRAGGHHSPAFVAEVVEFATRTNPDVPPTRPWSRTSRLYARWDGSQRVVDNLGRPLPCAVDLTDPRWPFLLASDNAKHRRTEGVLNELWQSGGRLGAHVDMQDARRYGTAATGALEEPVLTFCRLQGAAGLVLWPLPGYHTPGSSDFPRPVSLDTLPFDDKADVLAWRGNLTGRALPELGPGGSGRQHATELVEELGTGRDEEVVAALRTVPRYRVLDRLVDRPDTDVGLVLGKKWTTKEVPPQIARLVRPRLDYDGLYRNRYLLSVSGNDSASNFLMASDSRSVVLREEDGWEWFYDGQFRPWEHYVPLVRGGDDLEERLDWARAHPRECREMSARSRETVRLLVDPANRREYLQGIREVYESRIQSRS
jgi:hypothetical protein